MLRFTKNKLMEILNNKFKKEIQDNKLEIKIITDWDNFKATIIIVSKNTHGYFIHTAVDSNIKRSLMDEKENYDVICFVDIEEENIETLFTKINTAIKKNLFDRVILTKEWFNNCYVIMKKTLKIY